MAYASAAHGTPSVRIPHMAMPKLRWPRLSREPRVADDGRHDQPDVPCRPLSATASRAASRLTRSPRSRCPTTRLWQVNIFHVACADTDMPAAEEGGGRPSPRNVAGTVSQAGPNESTGPELVVVGLKDVQRRLPCDGSQVADHGRSVAYAAEPWLDHYRRPATGASIVN